MFIALWRTGSPWRRPVPKPPRMLWAIRGQVVRFLNSIAGRGRLSGALLCYWKQKRHNRTFLFVNLQRGTVLIDVFFSATGINKRLQHAHNALFLGKGSAAECGGFNSGLLSTTGGRGWTKVAVGWQ